jgi:polyphosphate glucokinase
MAPSAAASAGGNLKTLAVDVGGTGIKCLVLDSGDKAITENLRIATPKPAIPKAIVGAILKLAKQQGNFDRVSVGFPGVVRDGVVENAHNLDPTGAGVKLQSLLAEKFDKPVRVMNDAAVQGYGAISGKGVELTITLGTGLGSSLFLNGQLVPGLELAHHPFRKGETYEEQLGNAALQKAGKKRWNKRLAKAIEHFQKLFNYDRLYIGGGNSKKVDIQLPGNAKLVANTDGLFGGIALWKHS